MRPPKKASKATRADRERSAASEAILELTTSILGGDAHTTPWDEPSRDWGRRGNNPTRIFRKTFRREVFLGTW